jgi:hypothetical protein
MDGYSAGLAMSAADKRCAGRGGDGLLKLIHLITCDFWSTGEERPLLLLR